MLRIGVGQIQVSQLVQILTIEPLIKIGEDGRAKPWLASGWRSSPDGLTFVVTLKPDVVFHDGSRLTAPMVVEVLRQTLPQTMGAAYEDVAGIEAAGEQEIAFTLRRPSAFLLEALEGGLQKPGAAGIGTGPFIPSGTGDSVELSANVNYHLGRPAVEKIVVSRYPSVRTAWAEMLRDHLDMVYELGRDARSSLESATSVNVFTYVRHYQYIILLNTKRPALRTAAVRRALNAAIDRDTLLQEAFEGHGLASYGPVWPTHWAVQEDRVGFRFDPAAADQIVKAHGKVIFKCLVATDDERIALAVKRQLEQVGVEMTVEEGSIEHNLEAVKNGDFDAVLWATLSGPSMLRPYSWWHSRGYFNRGYSSEAVDASLDLIRHSVSDDAYQAGVVSFENAILNDPPAIFLAWDERARALSRRFEAPGAEPGVDILGTLRLWRPAAESAAPSSN